MSPNELKPAERLLVDLGISQPHEIDIEAIAFAQGLKVVYRPLDRCDALIMGDGKRGIITVNSVCAPERQRFSIAHELGHWYFDRNKVSMCAAGDIERGDRRSGPADAERIADRFGSELLLPTFMLRETIGSVKRVDWSLVRRIAGVFRTSMPATAIRLVEANVVPSLLVCLKQGRRAWFVRSGSVGERWFPRDEVDARSSAFALSFGKNLTPGRATSVKADVWFDSFRAERYTLSEEAFLASNDDVLCLINFTDQPMLAER
ncbi:MAG: ImmA/IrrE family metallo-endopeptidase [Sulfuricaulis sp.]